MLAATIALLAAALVGCGSSGGSSSSEIKVGAQFGLTGVNAAFDSTYADAAKLAFGDAQQKGINGHSLKVTWGDNASDPATAVSLARKFVAQDGAKILYGPAFTPTALSTMEVAQRLGAVFYTPGSINPQLTTPVKREVFAPQFSANDVATGVAKLASSMGAKRVGMLVEKDAYGQAALAAAKAALARYKLKVDDVVSIAADATDATSAALKFKRAGDDVVLLGVTVPAMAAMLNAEIHQGVYIPLITFAGSNTALDDLAKSDPRVRYYALTPLACPLGAACTEEFMTRWHARYPNKEPIVWTAQAYAAAEAFIQALHNVKSFDADGFVNGLETAPAFKAPELPCPIRFSSSSHKGTSCTRFYGITGGKVSFFGSDLGQNELH
ncbi:MAG TPA: ABC transporter substrate-binding protein [Thermoleophilaceae bacterium]|nr:ABC transporter substrate-binding protein [Thermoleophilaceae bacterium]